MKNTATTAYSEKDVTVSPIEFDGRNTWVRVETPEFNEAVMIRGRVSAKDAKQFATARALTQLAEF